jgi:hypothetical protein
MDFYAKGVTLHASRFFVLGEGGKLSEKDAFN